MRWLIKRLLSERALFMSSKILGLLMRPIILLLLLQFGYEVLARDFALILTAVASSFIFLNNQNYRLAYQHFFNAREDGRGRARGLRGRDILHDYAAGTVIHIALFLPICAFALWIWLGRADLLVYAIILVLTEKFYDDDQRALVYKRHYYAWTLNFALRVIWPSFVFLGMLLITGESFMAVYVAATIVGFAGYAVFQRRQFFRLLTAVVVRRLAAAPLAELRRYLYDYRREFMVAQVWAVVTTNVVMIDRFLINKASPEVFAHYILVVNIANILVTFHNLGYVSFRRPILLMAKTNALRELLALRNLFIPLVLAGLTLVAYVALDALGEPLTDISSWVVLAVTTLYLVHAWSLVPKELAFWRLRRGILLACDGATLILPVIVFLAGLQTPLFIAIATCTAVTLRFMVFALLLRYPCPSTHLSSGP